MVLAFHQPNFLPNLGFFYKMIQADVFVIVTNIQFQKREGWQRRHKIPMAQGDHWLTVPVFGSQNSLIKEVTVNNQVRWRRKHAAALRLAYARTRELVVLERVLGLYEGEYQRLVDVNMAFLVALRDVLGITTRVVLDEDVTGRKQQLMVNVCRKYGADQYLSGMGGRDYITPAYHQKMAKIGSGIRFVDRDMTAQYPYSALHYVLGEGVARTRQRLLVEEHAEAV